MCKALISVANSFSIRLKTNIGKAKMPRDYDRDYNEDTSADYKRKRRDDEAAGAGSAADAPEADGSHGHTASHAPLHDTPQLNEKTNAYLQECLMEKKTLEKKNIITKRLLDDGKLD